MRDQKVITKKRGRLAVADKNEHSGETSNSEVDLCLRAAYTGWEMIKYRVMCLSFIVFNISSLVYYCSNIIRGGATWVEKSCAEEGGRKVRVVLWTPFVRSRV